MANTPHHVFSEETDIESFSLSKVAGTNSLHAEMFYVENVTPIPREGQIVEFHVIGTSVQGMVTYSDLMHLEDGTRLHIQATRLQN